MFSLQALSKRFGAQTILDDADWQPSARDVVGLVGPNGAGKTTLLRILAGLEDVDGGAVVIPGGCTVGYLPQELAASDASGSALDVVLQGRDDLLALEEEIARTQTAMEEHRVGAVEAHARALEQYEARGGWSFRAMARQIASGLGFRDDELDRPIKTFSGGWQMRALLGRLLFRKPDVLLLDEPTNHLDTESLEWLEDFLGRYEGLVVVVSHDRWFLNRVAKTIVELQGGRLTSFPGNWDAYRERKATLIEQQLAAQSRQDREIARIQEFIERFRYKATKAKQVQSRARVLEKLERVEVATVQGRDIQFRFPQPPRGPRVVAHLDKAVKRYGELTVWDGLDFQVTRGDKIALMGPNGAGKTTLLKVLAGVLPLDGGQVEIGPGVQVAYFAQHAVESLRADRTVLDEMLAAADHDTAPRVRSILGAFGFSGDDPKKLVKVLSGGEKNRLALARMMLNAAGLLLLDEPTNHLDITSRQVLEFALQDYDGAFVVVSHDRYFVNEVATRVVHLEHGVATEYLGDYEYYRWKRAQEAEARAAAEPQADTLAASNSRKDARRAAATLREQKRAATGDLRIRLTALEREIATLEAEVEEAEARLGDPALYDDPPRAAACNQRYREATARLEQAMEEWADIAGAIEEIERGLDGAS